MEKKRRFLFVPLTGPVGDIAWQVFKEGHEVRYFIGDEYEKDIADSSQAVQLRPRSRRRSITCNGRSDRNIPRRRRPTGFAASRPAQPL